MIELELPAGVTCFEGEGQITVAHRDGIDTPFILPLLELFGTQLQLAHAAQAAARLIPDDVVYLDLTLEPGAPDPFDRVAKHRLRIHCRRALAREVVWAALWPLGIRAFRWILPEWTWGDQVTWGVIAGPADASHAQRACEFCFGEGGERLIYIEPPGTSDPEVRATLRTYAELISPAAESQDPDRPPSRIETVTTAVRAGPVPEVSAAHSILAGCSHLVTVVPSPVFWLVSEEEALPLRPGTAQWEPGKRLVLSPGSLDRDGTVLLFDPAKGNARLVRIP